jgi:hypothetical protein
MVGCSLLLSFMLCVVDNTSPHEQCQHIFLSLRSRPLDHRAIFARCVVKLRNTLTLWTAPGIFLELLFTSARTHNVGKNPCFWQIVFQVIGWAEML